MSIIKNSRSIVKMKNILSIFIFIFIVLLPFEEALASSAGTILKFLGIIICGICILCIVKRGNIQLNWIITMIAIWILYNIASYYWCISEKWWLYFVKTYISLVAMFLLLILNDSSFYNKKLLNRGFLLGGLSASLIIIFSPNAAHFTDEGRRTIMLFGTVLDPNIVCAILGLGIFAGLSEMIFKIQNQKKTKWYICGIFIIFLGVLFTGSRGGLVSVVVSFVIWLGLNLKFNIPRKYIKYIFLALIVVIVLVITILPEELIMSRFKLENLVGINEIKSGAHGRYKIWSFIPEIFKLSPIVGYGLGGFMSAMDIFYKEAAAHNMYFLILVENGIIGFIIFFVPVLVTLKKLYRKKYYDEFSMFISVLMICCFLDGVFYKFFWISWAYVCISLKKESGLGG